MQKSAGSRWDPAHAMIDTAASPLGFASDPETYYAVLAAYAAELDEKMQAMEEAYGRGDLLLVASHAHGLKSSSTYIGAPRIQQLALMTEQAGKAGSAEQMREILPGFLGSLRLLQQEIQARFGDKINVGF